MQSSHAISDSESFCRLRTASFLGLKLLRFVCFPCSFSPWPKGVAIAPSTWIQQALALGPETEEWPAAALLVLLKAQSESRALFFSCFFKVKVQFEICMLCRRFNGTLSPLLPPCKSLQVWEKYVCAASTYKTVWTELRLECLSRSKYMI